MPSQRSSSPPNSSLSLNTLKQSLLSPFITGPLLLYVTTLNPGILSKIPWPPRTTTLPLPFRIPFTKTNAITLRADPPLKTLKVLFSIGVIIHLNRFLNRLALNYWHLKKQGSPWSFDTEGAETIVITGGCSGFGKEMVKMFSSQTKSNIVVLDIQELPDELERREFHTKPASCNRPSPHTESHHHHHHHHHHHEIEKKVSIYGCVT